MVLFASPVPFPRVGHSHPRGQKPDQPDADHQPSQKDHRSGGPQAPMGLRKCPHVETDKQTVVIVHHILLTLLHAQKGQQNTKTLDNFFFFFFLLFLFFFLSPATIHSGVYDAQTGDRGVPEEIQCQEETQGLFTSSPSPTSSLSPLTQLCSNNPSTVSSSSFWGH